MKYFLQPATLFYVKVCFHCGTTTIIFVPFQPISEEVVRPRTRDEYEHQRQRNHNKPARYRIRYFVRPDISSQSRSRNSITSFIFFLCFSLSVCLRPPQPRAHDYENVNSGYGYSDHPVPPRAPTRPEAAYKGMKSM